MLPDNLFCVVLTMVIKGKKETIISALEKFDWSFRIHEETELSDGLVSVKIKADGDSCYFDATHFELTEYKNLKYIILANPDNDPDSDIIIFKNFGTTQQIINNAYTTPNVTLFLEELRGITFFPDQEFCHTYKDYSSGEPVTFEYDFSLKSLWEDDSKFSLYNEDIEMSVEEFRKALSEGATITGIQRIITDSTTGEEIERQDIPRRRDGSFDLFGGLLGGFSDEPETLEGLLEDAEDGDEGAMEELALIYLNGDEEFDIEPDPEKAVYWFEKLAEYDNSSAQFNLALHYAKGFGVERDFEKAAYWAQKAAENGDDDAPAMVEKYLKWADAAKKAELGNPQAMADLAAGYMFLGGSLDQAGPGNDYLDAFALASKSAELGNGDGLWTLALAYEHGRGVLKDTKMAVECYRKGAEIGHAPSQHSLACYYMRGDFLEKNEELAVELCLQSAAQGYNLAYFFLAKAYELGNGVEQDFDKAIEWGEKAAKVGTPDVQYEVAKLYMYENGEGRMINARQARYWLLQASDRGYQKAFDMLNFAPLWESEGIDLNNPFDMLPDGYEEAFKVIDNAIEYEDELFEKGFLPDEPHGMDTLGIFPRIHLMADAGDEKARKLLEEIAEFEEKEFN